MSDLTCAHCGEEAHSTFRGSSMTKRKSTEHETSDSDPFEFVNTDGAGVCRVESISTDSVEVDKEALKEAYIQGYKQGKHVEEVDGVSIRAAEDRFEQWFSLNYE